jgi:restriction system protein
MYSGTPLPLRAEVAETLLAADAAQASTDTLPVVAVGVALVDVGDRTDEGHLIRAVTPAWIQILKALATDPEALLRLSPRQFEELLAGGYNEEGWDVTLTPRSADGGRDIIARRSDFGAIRVLDQAKLYKPGHLVDAEEVRAMWGVLDRDRRASKAVVTTTSRFAPGVYKEFADSMPTRLDLRDGEQLNRWLTDVYARRR